MIFGERDDTSGMTTPEIIEREMHLACSKINNTGNRLREHLKQIQKCRRKEAWSDADLHALQIEAEVLARVAAQVEVLIDVRDLMINEECIALAEAGGTDD